MRVVYCPGHSDWFRREHMTQTEERRSAQTIFEEDGERGSLFPLDLKMGVGLELLVFTFASS